MCSALIWPHTAGVSREHNSETSATDKRSKLPASAGRVAEGAAELLSHHESEPTYVRRCCCSMLIPLCQHGATRRTIRPADTLTAALCVPPSVKGSYKSVVSVLVKFLRIGSLWSRLEGISDSTPRPVEIAQPGQGYRHVTAFTVGERRPGFHANSLLSKYGQCFLLAQKPL